jgi:hypothetical protein
MQALNDDHIILADIRSPTTMANIARSHGDQPRRSLQSRVSLQGHRAPNVTKDTPEFATPWHPGVHAG